MWEAAVSKPHDYYVHGGPVPNQGRPGGPVLSGASAKHLRPQSSYSLPHSSNGPSRWGWAGSHASSFDRRQLKVPPQPVRPAPIRPSHNKNPGTSVSVYIRMLWSYQFHRSEIMLGIRGTYSSFMSWCNVRVLGSFILSPQYISSSLAMRVGCRLRTRHLIRGKFLSYIYSKYAASVILPICTQRFT